MGNTIITKTKDPQALFRSQYYTDPPEVMDVFVREKESYFQSRLDGASEEMARIADRVYRRLHDARVMREVREYSESRKRVVRKIRDPYAVVAIPEARPTVFMEMAIMAHPKLKKASDAQQIEGFAIDEYEDYSYIQDKIMSGYVDDTEEWPMYEDTSPLGDYEIEDSVDLRMIQDYYVEKCLKEDEDLTDIDYHVM